MDKAQNRRQRGNYIVEIGEKWTLLYKMYNKWAKFPLNLCIMTIYKVNKQVINCSICIFVGFFLLWVLD